MAPLISLSLHSPPKPLQNPKSNITATHKPNSNITIVNQTTSSKRTFVLKTSSFCLITVASSQQKILESLAEAVNSKTVIKNSLSGIVNTKSWFQFFGDGFSIRVPPQFEDITEPEDFNAGLSLYGDKAKTRTFAARFASADGSEVLSVVIRPTNQLKITFLEAKDVSDFGSLKEAAKIFVPGGATVYSARTIKIKEEEGYRTYYFYEFGKYEQHASLVATVNSGKAYIAGASAPQFKWDDDGVRLRSAAMSLTVL